MCRIQKWGKKFVHHWPCLIIWMCHFLRKFCQIWDDIFLKENCSAFIFGSNKADWVILFFETAVSLSNSLGKAVERLVSTQSWTTAVVHDSVHVHFSLFLETATKWQNFFKETVLCIFQYFKSDVSIENFEILKLYYFLFLQIDSNLMISNFNELISVKLDESIFLKATFKLSLMANDENKFLPIFQILDIKNV